MQQDFLKQIDDYFNSKKSNEANILYLMVVAIIGFISYSYFFTPAESFFNQKQSKLNVVLQQLNQEKAYLNSITVAGDRQFHVKKLNKEIEDAKIKLEKISYTNGYVDNKLKELSYLLFNDKNWATFLDNISALAKKYNVRILKISNEFKEPSLQKIEQILNVSLEVKGNYKSIMKFLNAIEESRLVVDVQELDIEGKRSLEGSIKIAVWGMKY